MVRLCSSIAVTNLTPFRLALAAIAFVIFIETVDTSIVAIALPSIASDFHADFVLTQWVVLVSVLTQASLSLVVGWFGSAFGNKKILISGLVLVAVGNILCAMAPSLSWLIAFRLLQGIGMTMIGALVLAITTETFTTDRRPQGFGFVGAMVSIGIVVGPLAGGVILEHYHWRMIFVFDLLFVGVTFPLVLRYVEGRSGSGHRNFDLVGAAFFFASLLTFLLATSYNFGNMGNWVVPALYTVSGLSLALFIRQEFLCKHAVLNLSLFRDASLSVYLAARYLSFVVFGGIFLILPFYLENLLNFSPDTVGMLFAIQPLFFGTASWLSGKLTIRFGSRLLVICALTILASAYFWMSFLSSELIPWQFASQMTILGIGSGLLNAPSNQLIFGSARPHNLSMISSLTALTRIHARSTGIAILGSLWGTLALARAPVALTGSAVFANAQISSLGTVCFVGTLILLGVLSVCLVETWFHVRQSLPKLTLT